MHPKPWIWIQSSPSSGPTWSYLLHLLVPSEIYCLISTKLATWQTWNSSFSFQPPFLFLLEIYFYPAFLQSSTWIPPAWSPSVINLPKGSIPPLSSYNRCYLSCLFGSCPPESEIIIHVYITAPKDLKFLARRSHLLFHWIIPGLACSINFC